MPFCSSAIGLAMPGEEIVMPVLTKPPNKGSVERLLRSFLLLIIVLDVDLVKIYLDRTACCSLQCSKGQGEQLKVYIYAIQSISTKESPGTPP